MFVCFTKDQNRIKGSCVCSVAQSCPILYDPMDCVAHSAPLFMGLYRQEHWSGLPFPFPGDLPDPRIEPPLPLPHCPTFPALAGGLFTTLSPGKSKVKVKVEVTQSCLTLCNPTD